MTERICENCGKPIVRSYLLSASRLAAIRFCNTACKTAFCQGANALNRKPQEYEIRGEVTALIFRRKDGTVREGLIDTADLEKVLSVSRRWCGWRNKVGKFYVACTMPKSQSGRLLLHRFLTEAPADKLVDHKNHNGLDNRRENLRVTDSSINGLNREKSSPRRGVVFDEKSGKWIARVRFRNKWQYLGRHDDPEKAAEAVRTFIATTLAKASE